MILVSSVATDTRANMNYFRKWFPNHGRNVVLFQVSGEPAVWIHIRVGSLAVKRKLIFLEKQKSER